MLAYVAFGFAFNKVAYKYAILEALFPEYNSVLGLIWVVASLLHFLLYAGHKVNCNFIDEPDWLFPLKMTLHLWFLVI